MEKARKKTNKTLDDKTKAKLIEDYLTTPGLKYKDLAAKYGVEPSTISGYIKNRDKIQNRALLKGASKRFRTKPAKHTDLETKLYADFIQPRNASLPCSGTDIQEHAKRLAESMGLDKFKGSPNWLNGFKHRFGLSNVSTCGEANNVDLNEVEDWFQRNKTTLGLK